VKLPANAAIAPEADEVFGRQASAATSPHFSSRPVTQRRIRTSFCTTCERKCSQKKRSWLDKRSSVSSMKFERCWPAPNGTALRIRSIWMKEHLSGVTKFITLVPD